MLVIFRSVLLRGDLHLNGGYGALWKVLKVFGFMWKQEILVILLLGYLMIFHCFTEGL